jgi:Tfp pilus assembly protein FimT
MINRYSQNGLPESCKHDRTSISTFKEIAAVMAVLSTIVAFGVPSDAPNYTIAVSILVPCAISATLVVFWLSHTKEAWNTARISDHDYDRLSEFLRRADKHAIDLPLLQVRSGDSITNGLLNEWCKRASLKLAEFHKNYRKEMKALPRRYLSE